MAHLIRSGSDWTTHDLIAYNITVSLQSPEQFYGHPLPTDFTGIDPHLILGIPNTPGISGEANRLLKYLDLASKANSNQESAIDDFAQQILRVFGYDEQGLGGLSHYRIPLVISGDPNRSAQTDVCLLHWSTVLLLIQEDKSIFSISDPEPQVIAEAIAAFQHNNDTRTSLGEPKLNSMTIPCIVMTGTRPIFYLVPVTQELSNAVIQAQYPFSPTIVKKCIVELNGRCLRTLSEGTLDSMKAPDFRQMAFHHYIAFRTLAKAHWSTYTIPDRMEA